MNKIGVGGMGKGERGEDMTIDQGTEKKGGKKKERGQSDFLLAILDIYKTGMRKSKFKKRRGKID